MAEYGSGEQLFNFSKIGSIYLLICGIFGASNGEYIITHSPSHTQFLRNADSIDLSEVPKVVMSSFGLDLNKDMKWNGLSQGNLFKRPKAHCIVSVEGIEDGSINPPHLARYTLTNDVGSLDTEPVRNHFLSNMGHGSLMIDFADYSRIYDVKSQYPSLFKDMPSSFTHLKAIFSQGNSGLDPAEFKSLNISEQADLAFLGEIFMLKGVVNALKSNAQIAKDSHPDFFHFKMATLKDLIAEYGVQSAKVLDALEVLQHIIEQVTKEFRDLYNDNVVVEVVTYSLPQGLHRNVRSLQQAEAPKPANRTVQESINVATKVYSTYYSVYFNIILWLTVALIIATYFIAFGMWFIDPGRDSIIYRMTSQRLKRD